MAIRDESPRWAEDVSRESGDFIWAEEAPSAAPSAATTAVRSAPSKPYLTDEYEPTDADLWKKCLEVVNGERRDFTRNERTIHSPNHGRGYRHMPNPKGIAWAVKQYNGFDGGWKPRKEVLAHEAELRILGHGGVVVARQGELDALALCGLARVAGEAHGRVYWEATAQGRRVALAGLVAELVRRMNELLDKFDPAEARALGEWLENNFRVRSPKTPSGGKALKERLVRLVWVLEHRHATSKDPNPESIVEEIRRDWSEISGHLDVLVKFTDEGGTVVPKVVEFEGITYVNDVGVSQANVEKYAKRLGAMLASIKGWRAKALAGNLVVKLKSPADFRQKVSGKYNRQEDSMWVRTTPSILRRAAGYASFEYILVHELGHRYERHNPLPTDFDRPEWWTTRYSRTESLGGGSESFAELFALGHFGSKGNWDPAVLERFEDVMSGNRKV